MIDFEFFISNDTESYPKGNYVKCGEYSLKSGNNIFIVRCSGTGRQVLIKGRSKDNTTGTLSLCKVITYGKNIQNCISFLKYLRCSGTDHVISRLGECYF